MKSRISRLSDLIKCLKKDYFDRIDYELISFINNKNFIFQNNFVFNANKNSNSNNYTVNNNIIFFQ